MKKIIIIMVLLSFLLIGCTKSNNDFSSFANANRDNIEIHYPNKRGGYSYIILNDQGVDLELELKPAEEAKKFDDYIKIKKNQILNDINEILKLDKKTLEGNQNVTNEDCIVIKVKNNSDYLRLCRNGQMIFMNDKKHIAYSFSDDKYFELYESIITCIADINDNSELYYFGEIIP